MTIQTAKRLVKLEPDKFGWLISAFVFDPFSGNPSARGMAIAQFDAEGKLLPNRHLEYAEGGMYWWMAQEIRKEGMALEDFTPERIVSEYIRWKECGR